MTKEKKQKIKKTWLSIIIGLLVTVLSSNVATQNPVLDNAIRTAIESTAIAVIDIISSQSNDTTTHKTVLFPAENGAQKNN